MPSRMNSLFTLEGIGRNSAPTVPSRVRRPYSSKRRTVTVSGRPGAQSAMTMPLPEGSIRWIGGVTVAL